jgi:UDP-3-O-[3-hydroxymyristoyl] glucosamine N-acyltransferase
LEVTLKLPPLFEFAVQAEKLPLSKLSLKIRSGTEDVGEGVNVGVRVEVGPRVGVLVGVGVLVPVGVIVGVGVFVGEGPIVGVEVAVKVEVGVNVSVAVGVFVGVGMGPRVRKLNASTSLAAKPHVLPSKYKLVE